MGDIPEPGWEFGIAETLEMHWVGALLPPSLGSPVSRRHLATFGLSHPGVFNFCPHFGAFSAPKPLIPQILSLPRAGTGRSKAQLCVTGCTQLSPSPQEDFGDRMSPDTPRCNVGAVLWPPCPKCSTGRGPEPPLRMEPWHAASRAAAADGPRRGQPAAAKLRAVFLRTMVPHQGLSPSSWGRGEAVEMPQSYGGLRLQVGKLRHGVPGLPPALLCFAGS